MVMKSNSRILSYKDVIYVSASHIFLDSGTLLFANDLENRLGI
jgi:hypothetical protein